MWRRVALTMALLVNAVFQVDGKPASPGHSPLIMNGVPASDGQFPWTLSVEYDGSLGWLHMCGGILIEPNYALTGAKCVKTLDPTKLRAWAGLLYRNDTAATNAQVLYVDHVTIHPEYDEFAAGKPNDLAILRFNSTADTSQSNIALAELPTNTANDYSHDNCFINGWGRYSEAENLANQMLYSQIPVLKNQECSDLVSTINDADILHTHMCVMSDPPGRGACNGDGGGPLNCYDTPEPVGPLFVVGAFSWTITIEDNCDPYYPSVFTRLAEYLDWIEGNTP